MSLLESRSRLLETLCNNLRLMPQSADVTAPFQRNHADAYSTIGNSKKLSDSTGRKVAQTCPGGGVDNRILVDAIVAIKIGQIARLAKMIDPQRNDLVTRDAAKPGQCRRMAIGYRNNCRIGRQMVE